MPNKVVLELNPTQVEKLVEKLSMGEKVRLVRKLERQTFGKRIDELFKKIDQRRKRYPISNKEISREIEIVRRQVYGSRGS